MRLRDRLGPYGYALLHSPSMLHEWLLSPDSRRVARADLERAAARLPFLRRYPELARAARARLIEPYGAYTARVSPAAITISLELATFLAVTCEASAPRAILDLGSGFSSYVFRSHALRAGQRPALCSVDLSADWLEQTRRFLQTQAVSEDNLLTLDALRASGDDRFDLILLDLGDLSTRLGMLDEVIDRCRPGGWIVVDDMHVPDYRRAILERLGQRGLAAFSLRALTRHRLRYAYAVAC